MPPQVVHWIVSPIRASSVAGLPAAGLVPPAGVEPALIHAFKALPLPLGYGGNEDAPGGGPEAPVLRSVTGSAVLPGHGWAAGPRSCSSAGGTPPRGCGQRTAR